MVLINLSTKEIDTILVAFEMWKSNMDCGDDWTFEDSITSKLQKVA